MDRAVSTAPFERASTVSATPSVTLDRAATAVFVAGALATWVVLLYLARGLTFYQDEWSFIQVPGLYGSMANLFEPFNEHWATLSLIVYRSIFAVFGLSTYLPYMAVLLALHVVAAAALFVLVRQVAGPLVALGAAALVLWLGTGWQNLFWAFQMAFVGSTAAGLWALVAFTLPGRRAAAAGMLLLLASVMTSGMGIVFSAVVAGELLADPSRRRRLAWLVPVGVAYAVWYLVVGRRGVDTNRNPFSVEAVADVPRVVWNGALQSVESTVGPIPVVVPLLAAGLLLAPVVWLFTRRVDPRVVGAVGGLVLMYALIGLTRGHMGDLTSRSRYVYEGVFLVILALTGVLASLGAWSPDRSQRARTAIAAGVAVALASGLLYNVPRVGDGSTIMARRAGDTRGYITLIERLPAKDIHRSPSGTYIPEPDEMRRLIARHGDPRQDVLLPGVVPPLSATDLDRALFRLVGGRFTADRGLTGQPVPVEVVGSPGDAAPSGDGCIAVRPAAGPATATFRVNEGEALSVRSTSPGTGRAELHRARRSQPANGVDLPLDPAGATVRTPPMTDGEPWLVTLHFPPGAGDVTVCGAS